MSTTHSSNQVTTLFAFMFSKSNKFVSRGDTEEWSSKILERTGIQKASVIVFREPGWNNQMLDRTGGQFYRELEWNAPNFDLFTDEYISQNIGIIKKNMHKALRLQGVPRSALEKITAGIESALKSSLDATILMETIPFCLTEAGPFSSLKVFVVAYKGSLNVGFLSRLFG